MTTAPAEIQRLRENLARVIRGKDEVIDLLLTAFLAGGHVLLDDVPGVGKTTLAKALALSLDLEFRRVQFTPDLLPSDIVGTSVYDMEHGLFEFRPGPIFTNVLLADEINRASPRTQSALLECMSERQVTCDGESRLLPENFMVIATQNPVEFQGTYPLPEAQLDRFSMRLVLGYPEEDDEMAMLNDRAGVDPLAQLHAVLDGEKIAALRHAAGAVEIEKTVALYLSSIVRATRSDVRITLGCSPRSLLSLANCARAAAWMDGRDYVCPDDVRRLVLPVLAHRMRLSQESRYAGITAETILTELLEKIHMPV